MNGRRVLFIQHGETDKPGLLGEVLAERGIGMDILRPDLGEPIPDQLGIHSGLAVGGGAQGVYEVEKYPYLGLEIGLIKSAASQGKPVIGLCLGGQLMAASFGAEVHKGPHREIGFFPVTLDPISDFDPMWCDMPKTFVTTHWHGDVFEIPPGGMRLGHSAMTPNQLFRYGHSLYGLQFHLEMTPEILEEMVADSKDDLLGQGVDPEQLRKEGLAHLPNLRETATTVFSRWTDFL